MKSMDSIVQAARMRANVTSVHVRYVACAPDRAGALLARFDEAASPCWPHRHWPRDAFDGPMRVGATGGHGATRYRVEQYRPGHGVVFRFTAPERYEGIHGFLIAADGQGRTAITHFTHLRLSNYHRLMWHVCVRWVHDALIGDLLDGMESHLTGAVARPRRWKWRVHVIRHTLGGARLLADTFTFKRN